MKHTLLVCLYDRNVDLPVQLRIGESLDLIRIGIIVNCIGCIHPFRSVSQDTFCKLDFSLGFRYK